MELELLRCLTATDLATLTHATGTRSLVLMRHTPAGPCLVSWSPPDGGYKRRESVSVRGEELRFRGETTFRIFAETRPDTLGGDWLAPHLYTVERSDGRVVTQTQWRECDHFVREVYETVQVDLPVLRAAVERMRDEARVLEIEAKVAALTREREELRERLRLPRPW